MTDLEEVSDAAEPTVEATGEPTPAPVADTVPEPSDPSSDVFEWLKRGDGSWVLYQNGQVCADHEVIQAHVSERPA